MVGSLFLLFSLMAPLLEAQEFPSKELASLSSLTPENYPDKIDHLREKIEQYIKDKGPSCHNESSSPDKRPSPKERDICLKELKMFRKTFINHMFTARRRYLIDIHKRQLNNLEKTRDAVIENLEAPQRRRKKRKR